MACYSRCREPCRKKPPECKITIMEECIFIELGVVLFIIKAHSPGDDFWFQPYTQIVLKVIL